MTKRTTFLAVCLLVLAVAFAAAQGRIEVRKDGASLTLAADGRPVAALVPFAEKNFTAEDAVREIRPGLFEWTRTFRYAGPDYVRPARLTMEIEALYASRYGLIPAVSYDGNAWGSGLEPKGFVKDGQPWTFAYHRTSIPGATYSESEAWSVGLFSAPGQLIGGFSCSLEPRADKTVHRLVWPEEETPQVYAMRDAYQDAYRGDLRVSRGQTIALKAWIVVGAVTTPRHGWHALVDAAWSLNARTAKPRFEPEELWELGAQFADSLWAEEKGFGILHRPRLGPAGAGLGPAAVLEVRDRLGRAEHLPGQRHASRLSSVERAPLARQGDPVPRHVAQERPAEERSLPLPL
jgi:antitoxin (DNA-binding transcriptional repressor) of toxin-antitoxin stability system